MLGQSKSHEKKLSRESKSTGSILLLARRESANGETTIFEIVRYREWYRCGSGLHDSEIGILVFPFETQFMNQQNQHGKNANRSNDSTV